MTEHYIHVCVYTDPKFNGFQVEAFNNLDDASDFTRDTLRIPGTSIERFTVKLNELRKLSKVLIPPTEDDIDPYYEH